jgi:hypothetical protein
MFSRPKVEFLNEIPGVAELMPIIPAKELRHPWVNRAVLDFAKVRENPQWRHTKTVHTARCPGIFSLQRHGWVLRTWQDIEIMTTGDGHTCAWRAASSIGGDAVSFHPPKDLADYFEQWPENTLRNVLKINTGWRCVVPKGYYLMEMPIPLADEARFTAVPGYFSHEYGPAPMNVQLLWQVKQGSVLLPAGTPIAQYILVPKDQPEMVCRDADPKELRLSKLYEESKFVKNYNEVKKLFR